MPVLTPLAHAALDRALLRVAEGEQSALEEVYRQTSALLFGICLRLLPSRSDAEDTLQEIYLSAWRSAGRFDPSLGSGMTWLVTIARNRAVDRLRTHGKAHELAAALLVAEEPVAEDATRFLELSDEERRLAECLERIEADTAHMIRSAFFEGTTYAELAARTATPLPTVKSRIRRSFQKLRACMA